MSVWHKDLLLWGKSVWVQFEVAARRPLQNFKKYLPFMFVQQRQASESILQQMWASCNPWDLCSPQGHPQLSKFFLNSLPLPPNYLFPLCGSFLLGAKTSPLKPQTETRSAYLNASFPPPPVISKSSVSYSRVWLHKLVFHVY